MSNILPLRRNLPETWQESLRQFLLWKQAEGRAPRTLKDIADHVSRFFRRFPDTYPHHLREAVIAYMAQENLAPCSFNLRLSYLRGFFSWLIREGILAEDPTRGMKKRKDSGRVRSLPAETLALLLDLPDKATFSGLRDFALLLLSLDSGIRPGEALRLFPSDLNPVSLEVHVRPEVAKTRTPRTLLITTTTARTLSELIKARHLDWKNTVPLFCSASGLPMRTESWTHRLAHYGKKIGVSLSAYTLRHSFALLFLKNSGDAFSLQRLLGHSDLTMTRRYVNLSSEDIREAHQKASPILSLLPERRRVRKIK